MGPGEGGDSSGRGAGGLEGCWQDWDIIGGAVTSSVRDREVSPGCDVTGVMMSPGCDVTRGMTSPSGEVSVSCDVTRTMTSPGCDVTGVMTSLGHDITGL